MNRNEKLSHVIGLAQKGASDYTCREGLRELNQFVLDILLAEQKRSDQVSDYITKDAVFDLLHGDDELILFSRSYKENGSIGERLCKAINSIPAADVEPVVHAGFVRFTDGSWHCSNCTDELPVDDDDFQPSHAEYLAKYTAYCSRCGAKLDAGASAIFDAGPT